MGISILDDFYVTFMINILPKYDEWCAFLPYKQRHTGEVVVVVVEEDDYDLYALRFLILSDCLFAFPWFPLISVLVSAPFLTASVVWGAAASSALLLVCVFFAYSCSILASFNAWKVVSFCIIFLFANDKERAKQQYKPQNPSALGTTPLRGYPQP